MLMSMEFCSDEKNLSDYVDCCTALYKKAIELHTIEWEHSIEHPRF
jgi:hypothetical protein